MMFAVTCQNRFPANKSAHDREARIYYRKTEGHDRYGYGNSGRSFLCALNRKRCQRKAY